MKNTIILQNNIIAYRPICLVYFLINVKLKIIFELCSTQTSEPEIRISRYNSLHFSGETSTRGAEWFQCFPVSDSG